MKKGYLLIRNTKFSLFVFLTLSTFGVNAQNVGINATGAAPVSSAALDVDVANKGVLIPRVSLTSLTTFAPVTGTTTTSLLVYNTATGGVNPDTFQPGFYYWDGTRWRRLLTDQNLSFQSIDFYSSEAASPVDQSVGVNTIVNNINLGLTLSVIVPANSTAKIMLSYSEPIGTTSFNVPGMFLGVRALKNGVELPAGSRKYTVFPTPAGLSTTMVTVSAQYLDLVINNSAAPITITYSLNGYVETANAGGSASNIRFNMWDGNPANNNFNWGRGNFVAQAFIL